ncbi:alpha/beta-hydrolase [Ramaria rubella]|nr:alpha/beta-hydrolase [Ramaria rubella]
MVPTESPSFEKYTNTDSRNLIPKDKAKKTEDEATLPYRGPGVEVGLQKNSGIVSEVNGSKRLWTLWIDQRGCGLSTPLSTEGLKARFNDQEIAKYLKHFRADNLVRDCEAIRKILLGNKPDPEDRKWTILGASFGGFCAITYLSFFPGGLKEVFIAGGLAPLVSQPDIVYQRLMREYQSSAQYYAAIITREIVRTILDYLDTHAVTVPSGGRLTPRRWLHLGLEIGMHGGIDRIHQLVFRASNDLEQFGRLSYKLLLSVEAARFFDGNPLFVILQEAVYCQGQASRWSAARVLKEFPQFSWDYVKKRAHTEPVYFSGEMVFPDMFDDYSNLRPLKAAAEILANDNDWCPLYDLEQLEKNDVKVTSATYIDFNLAQDTTSHIKGIEQYINNHLLHNAIYVDPHEVMKQLFRLSKRRYD